MSRKYPPPLPSDPLAAALERFTPLLSAEDLERLLEELERPLAPAFRLNPLKVERVAVEDWALRYGWELRPVPFCPSGWWVESPRVPLSQTNEHRLGYYYIQDAASMLPVELFDWDGLAQPLVLDLAASPGGKTTHLASQLGDQGLIVANDSSASRITALRLVIQNWGAINTAITNFHGEKFGRWFPDTFDRVLLDAPCSMQGLRSTEAHPLRAVTARERSGLAERQLHLLDSALQAVRPGGQVVYSTCTLEPEEDEGVLDRWLRANVGLARLDDVAARLPAAAPALQEAYDRPFLPEIRNAARLWPHIFGTAGFFAARLTKLAPSSIEPQAFPERPLARAGYMPLDRNKVAGLASLIQDGYGIDLNQILVDHHAQLWWKGDRIFVFPLAFIERWPGLPVQGLGLLLGEDEPEGFSLSHEWVARFGAQFKAGRWILPPEHLAAWLKGEDIPGPFEIKKKTTPFVAVFDPEGRLLGRGKLSAGRLKNLLPRRLV